jgi:hypothetical protein
VVQHLLLRHGEALGELQAGEYALQQQFFDHLTLGLHTKSYINILREDHGSLVRRARRPIINGSGKEIKFPLTLALSPIGGEGIKMEPLSCFC